MLLSVTLLQYLQGIDQHGSIEEEQQEQQQPQPPSIKRSTPCQDPDIAQVQRSNEPTGKQMTVRAKVQWRLWIMCSSAFSSWQGQSDGGR